MTQLALPAPYGYKEGYHISLRAEEGFDEPRTEEIIVQFGCPRRIAKKAISCLHSSNRYDCVVSPFWFAHEASYLRVDLAKAGVHCLLLGKPDPAYPGRAAQKARQGGRFLPTPRHEEVQAQNLPRTREIEPFNFRELEIRNAALTEQHARRYSR